MDLHTKNGGPALPAEVDNNTGETVEGFFDEPVGAGERHQYRGMSLRDYFAAKAMQAVLSACSGKEFADNLCRRCTDHGDSIVKAIAEDAYTLADAMLTERTKS